ncbi:hypothetical protein BN946_scf185031.g2 [Trametes cinnabarina]|uniref:F-box domain-containing protein n=1 Tax=Pycnoporus cinnabarinus TaxID=5643 RepID=A0A060SIB5_PYCCI|nr:hypothetical protein BN946_scf185031.g2 [Trametes cinnabarina]
MDSRDSPLRHLDNDVLTAIFELLRPREGLRPLSATCRWIRDASKPVLFRHSWVGSTWLRGGGSKDTVSGYLPQSLWTFVRHLSFYGDFPAWPIDSLPQPEVLLRRADQTASFLRSPLELAFLAAVVEQVPVSLETLVVSSEFLPSLQSLSNVVWPNLRELRLQGERIVDETTPSTGPLLASMPQLQTLVLELAPPAGATPRQRICPKDDRELDRPCPWPDLLTFSIAYPDPDDTIYSLLPHTLRSLSLRCWPRHYIHVDWPAFTRGQTLGWQSPILSAAELLRIIQHRQWPCLSDLDIEYRQDECEKELLEALPAACPNLTTLTLHRYRMPGADDIDMTMLAQALAPLAHLRDLRLHLDFSQHPPAIAAVSDYWRPRVGALVYSKYHECATYLASTLATSLRSILFLVRILETNEWVPFFVMVDEAHQRTARINMLIAEEYELEWTAVGRLEELSTSTLMFHQTNLQDECTVNVFIVFANRIVRLFTE